MKVAPAGLRRHRHRHHRRPPRAEGLREGFHPRRLPRTIGRRARRSTGSCARERCRLDRVIAFEVPDSAIIERITGAARARSVDAVPSSGPSRPRRRGSAIRTAMALVQRPDDMEDRVRTRLAKYHGRRRRSSRSTRSAGSSAASTERPRPRPSSRPSSRRWAHEEHDADPEGGLGDRGDARGGAHRRRGAREGGGGGPARRDDPRRGPRGRRAHPRARRHPHVHRLPAPGRQVRVQALDLRVRQRGDRPRHPARGAHAERGRHPLDRHRRDLQRVPWATRRSRSRWGGSRPNRRS